MQCFEGRFEGAWTISPKNTEDVNANESEVVNFVGDDSITSRMGVAERTGSVEVADLQGSRSSDDSKWTTSDAGGGVWRNSKLEDI